MNDKERAALWVEIEKASKALVEAASWQDAEDCNRQINRLQAMVAQLLPRKADEPTHNGEISGR
jgi:hypothetical protein